MVYINGTRFNSFPECCYVCPFFLDWGQRQQKGTCTLFHKQKSKYNNPPKRCQQLFDKATGWLSSYCKECTRATKREEYARNRKVPNRLYQDDKGRLVEHKDCSTKIHWSEYMEQKLKRLFPTTKNEDLAIEFNISPRTVIRKAREMGLVKDKAWMQEHARKNCQYMRVLNMSMGNKGQFKKGEHASPETEFKKVIC